MRSLVWFRGKDMRVADHQPLLDAVASGDVVPLFVIEPNWANPEGAQQRPHHVQFLLDAVRDLERNLEHRGSRLLLAWGEPETVIPQLAAEWGIDRVLAYGRTEPWERELEGRLASSLDASLNIYEGETLCARDALRTGAGRPYSVFTPFARAFFEQVHVPKVLPAPNTITPVPKDVSSDVRLPTLEELGLTRNVNLQEGGERVARLRLERFLTRGAQEYGEARDRMDVQGTSRLSADLKFGTLSVRQVWHAIQRFRSRSALPAVADSALRYLNELLWREFSYHTLWHRPEVVDTPFRAEFRAFPWRQDEHEWQAWACGTTGYPIVDAAARQLLSEGFVHNRARMIAASFLTKHLMQSYQRGERHYLRYLTDGDVAPNNAGWQWSAGCGCDAQPYFRVFNPVTQGKRFDPEGNYVRRWVPELANLPSRYIHCPWEAPPTVLQAAQVTLGEAYPLPIVEHGFARTRFLSQAETLKP